MGDELSSTGAAMRARGDRGSRMRQMHGLIKWAAPRPGEEPGTRADRQQAGFAKNVGLVDKGSTPEIRAASRAAAEKNLQQYHQMTQAAGQSAEVARKRVENAGPVVVPRQIEKAGFTNDIRGTRDRKALAEIVGGKGTFVSTYKRLVAERDKAAGRHKNMVERYAHMHRQLHGQGPQPNVPG